MEFLIIWLLCGGLCFLLAREKNRNMWLGAFMGFLFGFFAVIYYIAVSKKENNINKE